MTAPETKDAPTLLGRLADDARRMVALSLVGAAAVAAFELPAALVTTPAPEVRVVTAFRLAIIDVALVTLLWACVLLPALLCAALGARLGLGLHARERALAWKGLLGPRDRTARELQPLAAWLWAALAGAALFVAGGALVAYYCITHFKEKQLTALLIAAAELGIAGVSAALAYVLGRLLGRAGARLHPRLGRVSPLGSVGAALVALAVLGVTALGVLVKLLPQMEPFVPWRHLLGALIFAVGCHGGRVLLARRGRLLPLPGPRRRLAVAASAGTAAILVALTLLRVGGDQEAKSVAVTGSPLLGSVVDLVRKATDLDRDGYGFLLGENDCAPLASHIHPLAPDIPDNGLDEDCNGRDLSFRSLPAYRTGERMPVPPDFVRDWNIVLITVDTVRYDHTGFGGYIERKGRNTTPNLDRLVERSVSFTFANAPSAGTMASVPAILTSKFFHSGIALDENVKPRMPPRLKPENVLIGELLKERGYYTGAILTHEYFNDWGMEQGFDTYDNELGKDHAPFKITSHDLTDRAIAWVARNGKRPKWFLWLHYIDPHGRYVAHPGEQSFGTSEEDLYDGELFYTDKHVGRLLEWLSRAPGAERTIVIITSDHGDAFNEHGFINHGQALYRELLHVPLIVQIPGLPPRTVDGATSPLDIVPTVCDLVGVDPTRHRFEGESLVPQIFYGKDAHDRVVFAETNWPRPLRAAITSRHKLIYKLKENIYEFYDLIADPWEKKNIYNKADKEALGRMKEYLDDWLERVYYARDAITNQAAAKLQDHVLATPPTPVIPVTGVALDSGRIEVVGLDPDKTRYKPGETLRVAVHFHVKERPSADFRLGIEAWRADEAGDAKARASAAKSPLRLTAGGLFPTTRWRAGEHIRDRFQLTVPATFGPGRITIGLRIAGGQGSALVSSGATRPGDPGMVILGEVELEAAPPAPQPGEIVKPSP